MILADSGFWIALGNRGDRHHQRALHAARKYSPEGFVTTWPVLTEVVHLLAHRVHVAQAVTFIGDIEHGAARIAEFAADALPRVAALMRRYANLPMDLADASLVVLAEELDEGRILSTDARDFDGYRWKNRKPFVNLLLAD
ncbi:MAG: PIN domain-containing protein [Proteobacteria bacterium]|nr:PIN domain-containing protein [Pseudomonadota bacterium]